MVAMRVLFDVVHPAHVHFYRHLWGELLGRGDECLVVARRKDVTVELLEGYGIPAVVVGGPRPGRVGQAAELAARIGHLVRLGRRFRPDVVLARNPAGMYAARLVGATGVFDTDDGTAGGPVSRLAVPAAHVVTTPACLEEDYGAKHRRYRGYKALAYCHPNRFRPDPGAVAACGLDPGREPYAVVRTVALTAAHDRGVRGLGPEVLRRLVDELSRHVRVVLSAEGDLPADLEELRLDAAPTVMLDVVASARLLVGDSGSMAAEAALLGVPAVYASTFGGPRRYLCDLERRYGLARVCDPGEPGRVIGICRDLVTDPGVPARWREARRRMVADTVDVTSWYRDLLDDLAGIRG